MHFVFNSLRPSDAYIYIGKLTIIGSDNVLSPAWRQAIIWTQAGILLIGLIGTNFIEILIEIHTFSFKKMHLNMSSGKWRPFCLGRNVLNLYSSSVKISAPSYQQRSDTQAVQCIIIQFFHKSYAYSSCSLVLFHCGLLLVDLPIFFRVTSLALGQS